MKNVILMAPPAGKPGSRQLHVRDRRYTIRHPFAADVEAMDLESGSAVSGITSDLSMGGCFVCTNKVLPIGSRVRLKLSLKSQVVEALAVVRIVKPRIGMGIEFLDVNGNHDSVLQRWLQQLSRDR